MNKLNISNWKQFSLGDEKYFQIKRIKKPVILSNYNLSLIKERGKFPLISSSSENNGVVGWIYSEEEILHKSNAITIAQDGSIFSSFFQSSDFYTRINMLIFRIKGRELNYYLAFFLCSIISLEKSKYSYGRTLKEEDILKTKIPLPVDERGDPNWLWMENFSKRIWNKVKEDIIKIIDIEREREREREQKLVLLIEKNSESVIIFMFSAPKPLKEKKSQLENLLMSPPKIPSMVMKVLPTLELKKRMW
ncbi:MAG: restriction endonuclease subunit S [Candidatus Moeniiplasma glomeromycotorum]|nr:restriction endonuclease subunit S [Candidatus Moeniiplasma glomeromycotorum]MCE8162254.1 restriction endonuclease subunit S [Candidatus Moeniiplasma glomeromycotorum]MCE8166090.1 restriction endonuclease subunit S [Candidatus Moeniiplasma glomeromycotorum]MCE8166653.1 restriction endonuclease subunit S [Candidatus Moeniiplasma glomeromycotorum]